MSNTLTTERPPVARPAGPPADHSLTPASGRRWRAFALLVAAYFMTVVDFTIVNVALPTIGRDLHLSESRLQWVVTAYALAFACLLLLGGRAADLLGRRRLLMVGLGVFTAASLGGGVAPSGAFLIAMRGLQGLGAALVLPAAMSIVMEMFGEGPDRNKALGIWGGMGALGGTVGLLTGGVLTTYVGWQWIFLVNVPIGLAVLIAAPTMVPESRAERPQRRYDPFGAVTVTAALLILIYAISEAPQAGWTAVRTIDLLIVGAALLAVFLVIEANVEAPLLPLRLFRLSTVAGSNAVGFLLGASFLTFVFIGTLYMQQVLGFSALATGAAWMTTSVTSLAFAGLSQKLVTKTSAKAVMTVGMTIIGGAMLWAAHAPADGQFWVDLAGPFFLCGIGTAFAFIPISIGALTGITEQDAGVASGLLNTSQNVGSAIGVAIASSLAASQFHTLVQQGHTSSAALAGGFQLALWVCGLCGLLAVPAAFTLMRRRGRLDKIRTEIARRTS